MVLAVLSLSACNRSTSAIDSVATAPELPVAVNAVDPASAIARVRVAPVVGAPPAAAQTLSDRLESEAAARRIALVAAGTATHDMKGYFSAITEGGNTTVIYVWDIFDPAGNRVHRIQGQVSAPGTSPDGWTSVSAETLATVAMRTMEELAAWIGQGS